MAKKVIQVPVGEKLLAALDRTARKRNKARAELIREACECYLAQVESEELDRLYQHGYKMVPETAEVGEAQIGLAAGILSEELW